MCGYTTTSRNGNTGSSERRPAGRISEDSADMMIPYGGNTPARGRIHVYRMEASRARIKPRCVHEPEQAAGARKPGREGTRARFRGRGSVPLAASGTGTAYAAS